MTKKFVYVDNATNQETEAEAYILEDYVSESGISLQITTSQRKLRHEKHN